MTNRSKLFMLLIGLAVPILYLIARLYHENNLLETRLRHFMLATELSATSRSLLIDAILEDAARSNERLEALLEQRGVEYSVRRETGFIYIGAGYLTFRYDQEGQLLSIVADK